VNPQNGFDLKSMFETLRENVSRFGGFSPEQVKRAGLLGEAGLRNEILLALSKKALSGTALRAQLTEAGKHVQASQLYPLLESMLDEGLLAVSMKKELKTYSLTESGKKAAEGLQIEEPVAPEAVEGSWLLPNWVDLRGEVPKAAVRLAKVTTEVTQHGTQEQQKQAAAVLDEARKSIHKILASE
jgi:DNA-binding PadR family transcriptional regulator